MALDAAVAPAADSTRLLRVALFSLLFAFVLFCSVSQIRDEMKTFVLAGHETSASMLNWSLYELLENGDLMSKVIFCAGVVFHSMTWERKGRNPSVVESNPDVCVRWLHVTLHTRQYNHT